ncbi:serum amyloid A-5 protein-like [Homarus americanus]|uniref:Serum amyloid A-3 protein-like 1 n=1 Tax=Homarus americanus TaxID=6706 RepID=A0A8J5N695_HOMAM|nr:serum amyloid A-5 protein-like [Homarus americanus]XP_042212800.1 serum amyloid A-5 protein-like [Homarus americanus]KAG7173937.1 Serum amyloid A-3 protein-like 1 [Homarus americanus]
MKYSFAVLAVVLVAASVVAADPDPGFWSRGKQRIRDSVKFAKDASRGTSDMHRAYRDMRKANWRNSDRYFHSRGNADAASRGPGGRWAAEVISNTREITDRLRGGSAADSARDQAANRWGRNGGDPNRYRPQGLPLQY